MALSAGTIFECNPSATAGTVNGGGFNPGRTPPSGASTIITNPTSATPVLYTGMYTFDADDVGHWVYFPVQTDITSGWYQISSVDIGANTVTLAADVGEGETYNYRDFTPTTGTGVGTSTTGATFLIDYSRSTSALATVTDLASTNATTNPATISSATLNFTDKHIGNIIHITAGTNWTRGWYEIVSTSTNEATLDRAVGASASISNGTVYLGGSCSLTGTGANLGAGALLALSSSLLFFIKSGTHTLGENVVSGSPNGNYIEGYYQRRGDRPTLDTNMPTFACGSNRSFGPGYNTICRNIYATGTNTYVASTNGSFAGTSYIECKFENLSTTANRYALNPQGSCVVMRCECVSIRGYGIYFNQGAGQFIYGNYIHDCNIGIGYAAGGYGGTVAFNVVVGCVTNGIACSNPGGKIINNTVIGYDTLDPTVGISLGGTSSLIILNNCVTGYDTGMSASNYGAVLGHFIDNNNTYNNTTETSNILLEPNNISVDPVYTNLPATLSGSTATTTSGNHLVESGATFQTWGVVAGDYVWVKSGTGPTAGIYQIQSVDSETQITTVQTLTANATGDKVWRIIPLRSTINLLPTGNI